MGEDSALDPASMLGNVPAVADQPALETPPTMEPLASDAPPVVEAPPVQGARPESAPLEMDRMTFSGTGSEYFRIWIVNLALTIATLGIYSAWAKVRRLQFFYRHTRLAGAGFDYHGDPIAILKGRIVALILFGLYSAMGYVGTWMTLVILVVLAVLLPWLLGRSLRFRLHNSSYRGLRFRFHGTTKQAYWIFLAMPILMVVSLFTLGPFWHQRIKRYQFSNAAFGRTRFETFAEVGEFYVAHILAGMLMGALVMGMVLFFAVVFALAGGASGDSGVAPDTDLPTLFLPAIFIGYMLAFVGSRAITTARIQNAVWNRARLGTMGFICDVSIMRLFWLQLSNLAATVLTLGFFRPFAQVRLAKYMAGCMTLVRAAPFAVFAAAGSDDVTAMGEETAELFDFDIGF